MERIDGVSLRKILRREGRLPLARSVALARQVLAGLGAAHAAGVIHADVKADNVLVVGDGGRETVKLIDFGVAAVADAPHTCGEMSGTPDYMAPEVICGQAPSPAADLYAVGVLIYAMLTGDTPFGGGASAAILERHLHDDVIPPSLRFPELDLPVRLERLILQALEKDARARPASAEVFAAELAASALPGPEIGRSRFAAGTQPFWTEAPTRNLGEPSTETRLTRRRIKPSLPNLRARLVRAIERGDIDTIVVASLDIVRLHVDRHALNSAVRELESTIHVLTGGAGLAADVTPSPVWRLMLSLAALYLGLGSAQRARTATLAALGQARLHGSAIGCDRAEQMLGKIIRTAVR
jgi:serine/threonine protein kinase